MSAAGGSYEIVPYRPDLKHQTAALQEFLWRGGKRDNLVYLEWKYERNPYLPSPLVYLALHAGRVVAMRGMYGSCWEAGPRSERFVVPCADDLVIAPAHRNRGLVGQIMRSALTDLERRGYPVAFSLSAGAATMASSLADGWRGIGSVQEVSRVRSPLSWRWRLGTRMRDWRVLWRWAGAVAHGPRPFRHLDRLIRRPPPGRAVTAGLEPRPGEMADLIRRLGHDGRIRHLRDEEYLTWRFANPLHEYRFLWAGGDRLEGYLVLRSARRGASSRVNILDWEATDRSARLALLRAATEWGRFSELTTWTLGLPDEFLAMLRDAGFAPASRHRLVRQGPLVLVREVGRPPHPGGPRLGAKLLLDRSGWDMRMLYTMAG